MADNTDSLIREIEEELRREQFARLWQRYGTYFIAGAVAFVLAVAGYKYWEYNRISTAESSGARYEAALRLAQSGKSQEAQEAFAALAGGSSAAYATLARLQMAAATADAGKTSEAIAAYDAIAAGGADVLLRDYAALQAAALSLETADWTQMQNRLNDLANDSNPWRASARELLGLAAYRAGKLDEARKQFERLLGDRATPPSMVERTQLMLNVLTEAEAAGSAASGQAGATTRQAPASKE